MRRLALIAPFGLFDEADPPTDPWAQRGDAVPGLMCADPAIWTAMKTAPEGANSIEWPIEQVRANEAAARIFWPLGNTKIEKRLGLIQAPTLLLWGAQDRIMPRTYADRFRQRDRREDRNSGGRGRRASGGVGQADGSGAGDSEIHAMNSAWCHVPFQTGARFSRNASIPSAASRAIMFRTMTSEA